MISGAVQQSGAAVFETTNQESDYANEYINDLAAEFMIKKDNPDETIEKLRVQKSVDVLYADQALYNSARLNNPSWHPVRND